MFNSTVAHVSAGVHPSTTSNVLQLIHELQGTRNVPLTASIAALIALVLYYFFGRRWTAGKTESSDNIPVLRGTPILGNWRFFSDRYEFIKEGTRKFGSAFQFRILNVWEFFCIVHCDRTDTFNLAQGSCAEWRTSSEGLLDFEQP